MIVEVGYRCGTGAATRPEPSSLRRTLFWFLLCARHRFRPKRTEEEERRDFCWRKAGLSSHRGLMQRRNSRAYLQAGSSCGNASVSQIFLLFVSWCFEKVSNNSFFRLIFGVWWSHGLSGFFFLRVSRLWSLCCYGAFFFFRSFFKISRGRILLFFRSCRIRGGNIDCLYVGVFWFFLLGGLFCLFLKRFYLWSASLLLRVKGGKRTS